MRDGSPILPITSSYVMTSYYRQIVEMESNLTIPFAKSNYNSYDVYCLETQLYIFLKHYDRLLQPIFLSRAFNGSKKMILTVEMHYQGKQIQLSYNFREKLQNVIDDYIQNYRHYMVIYDNQLDDTYPPDWSYDVLSTVPWDQEIFKQQSINGEYILLIDIRRDYQKKRDAELYSPLDTDYIEKIGTVEYETPTKGLYSPDEIEPDFTKERLYWTTVIETILTYLYEQGTVKSSLEFAMEWSLLPVSWKGFTKVMLSSFSKPENRPDPEVNYNDLELYVHQKLPILETADYTNRLFIAPWDNNELFSHEGNKTEFLRSRASGNDIISLPIGDNYAQRHFFLLSLKSKGIFSSETPMYVFRDQFIFSLDNVIIKGKSKIEICQMILDLFNKAVYESTGQITIIKYGYLDDAKYAAEKIMTKAFSISDGLNETNRKAIYYKTEDSIKPWTVSLNIAEYENPETLSRSINKKVNDIRKIETKRLK